MVSEIVGLLLIPRCKAGLQSGWGVIGMAFVSPPVCPSFRPKQFPVRSISPETLE